MRLRISFAISRSDFIDRLAELLGGALGEFYKAELGRATGCAMSVDINGWNSEVEQHLKRFEALFGKPTRAKLNKIETLKISLNDMEFQSDMDKREYAIKSYETYQYTLPLPKGLTPNSPIFTQALDKFTGMVYDRAREVLRKQKNV